MEREREAARERLSERRMEEKRDRMRGKTKEEGKERGVGRVREGGIACVAGGIWRARNKVLAS